MGLFPVGPVWKTSKGRRRGGILIRWPNHLSGLLSTRRSSSSTPSSLRMSELLTLSLRLRKVISAVTKGEGWNVDGLVNRELCLPAQLPHHNGPVQRPHYRRCRTNPSVHLRSILPSPVNTTPRYLNSFAWDSNSLIRQRTMASDLEVLTLIPTTSHWASVGDLHAQDPAFA